MLKMLILRTDDPGSQHRRKNSMINVHDLISGGLISVPLTVIAFVLLYLVVFRDSDTSRKSKHPHE